MSKLTRKEFAEAILVQLRAVGPQTVAEIRQDLGITKKDAEDAVWFLASRGQIEYDWPMSAPPAYKVAAMREP